MDADGSESKFQTLNFPVNVYRSENQFREQSQNNSRAKILTNKKRIRVKENRSFTLRTKTNT
jgi:hypothetical protein